MTSVWLAGLVAVYWLLAWGLCHLQDRWNQRHGEEATDED